MLSLHHFPSPYVRSRFPQSRKYKARRPQMSVESQNVLYAIGAIFNLFFVSWFSFTNIHDSQDSRGKGGWLFL